MLKGLADLESVSPFVYTWYVIGMLEDLGNTIVIFRIICYNNICRYKAHRLWVAVLYGLWTWPSLTGLSKREGLLLV